MARCATGRIGRRLVLGAALAALGASGTVIAGPAASATSFDVAVTCGLGVDAPGGNVVTLPGSAAPGDVIVVRYSGCSWILDDGAFAAVVPDGLVPEQRYRPGFALPGPTGIVSVQVLRAPPGGEAITLLYASAPNDVGVAINQPYRPMPAVDARARRAPGRCNAISVTVVGVPSAERLEVDIAWRNGRQPQGTAYEGTGTGGEHWSHTYAVKRRSGVSFPRHAFRLTVYPSGAFFEGVDPMTELRPVARVAACR